MINMFPNESFSICISLKSVLESDLKKEQEQLQNNIRKCMEYAKLSQSETGDIIKQIQKIVIGGKDSSKEIKNLSIQEVGNMLAAVFYSYNTFCIERRPIRIRGSDKEQISKYIISVTNNATS